MDILLVEDSPGDVRLTLEVFQDANPSVGMHLATDGREAMAYLRQEGVFANAPRTDLILLDLNMPKWMGGKFWVAKAACTVGRYQSAVQRQAGCGRKRLPRVDWVGEEGPDGETANKGRALPELELSRRPGGMQREAGTPTVSG
jgi:hypothetical protein